MTNQRIDQPLQRYTNRIPDCPCTACGKTIAIGEEKAWVRRDGHSLNYHVGCIPQAPRLCRAFLWCSNPAVTTLHHPILGAVDACERCASKLREVN